MSHDHSERDVEAILDACFVALITAVLTYGVCEAVVTLRWWALAVWLSTVLLIPVAIVAGQQITEFLEREE